MKGKFLYKNGVLLAEGVSLAAIAEEFGTPAYVYSANGIRENYQRLADSFSGIDVLVAYSVKSNSNLSVLATLNALDAGFDIVSGGELARVRHVGVPGERIIFAGVGKTAEEMRFALQEGVAEFNVESEPEAERLDAVARSMGVTAPVALRINPNVDAKTHKYITTGKTENKFGISLERAFALGKRIAAEMPNLRLMGLHCHIGSQILDSSIHPQVVSIVIDFARKLVGETGTRLENLNFGGGFGIAYEGGQEALDLKPFADALRPVLKDLGVRLVLEPGRSIAGPAGVLLTRVEYIKRGDARTFVIVDAAMTELMRPTLYEAHHDIAAVEMRNGVSAETVDVVGPVCESGDFLALGRSMVVPREGDLLAVMDAGAYGFVMANTYNARPRVAEILVDGDEAHLVRRRESVADLLRHEQLPALDRLIAAVSPL